MQIAGEHSAKVSVRKACVPKPVILKALIVEKQLFLWLIGDAIGHKKLNF